MNELDVLVAEAEDIVRYFAGRITDADATALALALKREDVRNALTEDILSKYVCTKSIPVWRRAAECAGYEVYFENDSPPFGPMRSYVAVLDIKEKRS